MLHRAHEGSYLHTVSARVVTGPIPQSDYSLDIVGLAPNAVTVHFIDDGFELYRVSTERGVEKAVMQSRGQTTFTVWTAFLRLLAMFEIITVNRQCNELSFLYVGGSADTYIPVTLFHLEGKGPEEMKCALCKHLCNLKPM